MNRNEHTISKLLLVALALALLLSTILLITTMLHLRQIPKAGERDHYTNQSAPTLIPQQAKRSINAEPKYTNPTPDTLTLEADRAASLTSSSSPLRGPELDVGVRTWVTGRVEYNTAVHFTLPPGLGERQIQKAVLKVCYLGSWGTNEKRPVTAHRLTEKWSEFAAPFTISRESAFATNIVGGPTAAWVLWDATATVQYWVAHPGENFGILLGSDPTIPRENSLRFASTRFEDASLYPVLEIVSSSSAR